MEKVRASDRERYAHDPEKRNATVREWRASNPEKAKASCRAWQISNREQVNYTHREARLKSYGISLGQFIGMAVAQEAKCVICRGQGKLVVDHCHTTGRVRGLLCRKCNLGIGHLKDSPEMLQRALAYLEKQ